MKGLSSDFKLTFGKFKNQSIYYIIKVEIWWVKWAVNKGLLELPKDIKL